MIGYFLSSDADQDLQDIYDYSEEVWGERQAERYIVSLYNTFDLLDVNPDIGRARHELGKDIRTIPHRAHLIFYMPWKNEVAILRVLNGARDYESVLDEYDPVPGILEKRPG